MPECVWINPGCVWSCLNVANFVRMAFALYSPIVMPYLKETYTVFVESKNEIFSIVPGSIWFCFLFLDWILLQTRFQIWCYLWGRQGPEDLNLTQPVRYQVNITLMFFWCLTYLLCCCCFFPSWHFKGVNQRFTKAVIL